MDIDGIRRLPRKQPVKQTVVDAPKQARSASAMRTAELAKSFPVPRYVAPKRPARIVKKRRWTRATAWRTAGIGAALVLVTAGFLGWRVYVTMHHVFRGNKTIAALASKPVTPDLLQGEGDGRVNILLLGVGGPGHDGADLTDTIVLFSVDPVNGTATMLSIPRDLWVKQPVNYFGAEQKINAAYSSGKYRVLGKVDVRNDDTAAVEAGLANLDQVIHTVTGVEVNYHVLVNFQAFRQAVDTVGGVTVNVPSALVDPTMAWENHWNPVLAPAGVQQMDGVKALQYARSRETSSDFARSQRQRQILVALKDKVFTLGTLSNPAKLDALMNTLGANVYSDFSTQGAMRLYSIMKKVDDTKIHSIELTTPPHKLVTTGQIGNASVVRPLAGLFDYSDIQTYVRSQLPDGYLVKEHASIAVISSTQAAATAAASELKTYGYHVTDTVVTKQAILTPAVVDMSKGHDPFTLHYLETHYDTHAIQTLPADVHLASGGVKFAILVP